MTDTKHPSPCWRALGRYASEVLVIIIGITLSFLFDEWRQEREDRRAEREYLVALRADLRVDSMLLSFNIAAGNHFVRATERLATFARPADIADSLHILLDAACSYAAFNPSTATYEELRQTGRTALLRDDTLRRTLIGLYTSMYPAEREVSAVDKEYVLQRLIPAVGEHFPISTDAGMMAAARGNISALQAPRVRNLLVTGAAFKRGVIGAHEAARKVCSALLKRVENCLKREQ